MIKIDNYTFKNELEDHAKAKAKRLATEFYKTAYPKLDDKTQKICVKSSMHGIDAKIEKGIYIYDDDNDLVGMALYHVVPRKPSDVFLDVIIFDQDIRKTYTGVECEKGASSLLRTVIGVVGYVAKKNSKDKIVLNLNDDILYLENNFTQLGFNKVTYEQLELNTNVYQKKLGLSK